ncbi:putative amino acid ABC transporter, periplasmic binding protein [Legionella birminghamensis]|uniref:Amino acid ABC transporter, periplasmic binding protein n=1 Tax=Legionella birminghamensis TaxID=28083 RepID=A0A378IFQ6_9GAMM|nr:transporter substrate-binding domain-containing protein [Legionella birminghamensis]KTC68235.1 putative amino acid ABC transporter, periplasmic binding protein [Legionella birminghamensis]STX31054.1 putative amino acid ABC transporter, periplasmic binding protein [Legionella birminghamensis]
MKIICYFLLCLLSLSNVTFAQGEPLVVAVDNFSPPFVMRAGNNVFNGFDVEMMEHICKIINRTCQYKPVHFHSLLAEVEGKTSEIAVGAITITPERASLVNFTAPYMLSQFRFMSKQALSQQPFSLDLLSNKKIGVEEGTLFPQLVLTLGIKNPKIELYDTEDDILVALQNDEIDLALLDNATAVYWANHSSGSLVVLGQKETYGFGYGIAVNKDNLNLLQAINTAISQYHASEDFKKDYDRYFGDFK